MNYIIYDPSGNITAIVEGIVEEKEQRKKINDKIMQMEPNVEQVGFVNPKRHQVMMAGGEFCGNFMRSAAKYYLQDKDGELVLEDLGNQINVTVGIKNQEKYAYIPIIKGDFNNCIQEIDETTAIVKLNGITHLVMMEVAEQILAQSNENLKQIAYNQLKKYELLKEKASGVMFVDQGKLYPVVYVKEIDTLFFENACGSGTTAVGIYLSYKRKQNIEEKIIQPSNQIIKVKVEIEENNLISAKISGEVEELKRNIVLI